MDWFYRYGEIVDVNLVRDKGTGKSKGFAFVAYEDQRSTNLAVGQYLFFSLASFYVENGVFCDYDCAQLVFEVVLCFFFPPLIMQ